MSGPSLQVQVIGAGYVGLVTALCLVRRSDVLVRVVEANADRLNMLKQGKAPFFEPGLDELFGHARQRDRIEFHSGLDSAWMSLQPTLTLICVGTPSSLDGEANLVYLRNAVSDIARALQHVSGLANQVVAVKSTVPPGTTDREVVGALHQFKDVEVAMIPEFLREGSAVEDGLNVDRVVVGSRGSKAANMLIEAMALEPSVPLVKCTPLEAELSKYANNALLATLISFANEIAALGRSAGIFGLDAVWASVLADKRWKCGNKVPSIASYLRSGPGFGGSCFPKDVRALAQFAISQGIETPILSGIHQTNQNTKARLADHVISICEHGDHVAILGLAFKPETSDVRESPTFDVVLRLSQAGLKVTVHDPVAEWPVDIECPIGVSFSRDLPKCLRGASVAVLMTPWSEYLTRQMEEQMHQFLVKKVVDPRGALSGLGWHKVNVVPF